MKKIVACILVLSFLLLVSCTEMPVEESEQVSAQTANSSTASGTSAEMSLQSSAESSHVPSKELSQEESLAVSEPSDTPSEESDTTSEESNPPAEEVGPSLEDEDWEALFFEIYGFWPDFYQILSKTESIQELAMVWLNNPIDKWHYAYAVEQYNATDWSEAAHTAMENWYREMEESIAYVKECLPDFGTKLEQEQKAWMDAVQLQTELPDQVVYLADYHGSMHIALYAADVEEMYRERAFRLLYMEAVCKEEFGPENHEIGIRMEVPAGMEASPAEAYLYAPSFGDSVDPFWILSMEGIDAHLLWMEHNPIDEWVETYVEEYDDYDYMHDVEIANWKREIEESAQVIFACFPELEELLKKEAEAWEKGLLGQNMLGLVTGTDRYGTIHLLLAGDEVVSQYRRRAFRMLYLEMACIEIFELTDCTPGIEFVLPEE